MNGRKFRIAIVALVFLLGMYISGQMADREMPTWAALLVSVLFSGGAAAGTNWELTKMQAQWIEEEKAGGGKR